MKIPVSNIQNGEDKFIVFNNDSGVTDYVKRNLIYEPYLFEYIRNNINLYGKHIIDIGGNIGHHAIRFSKLCSGGGKVFTFEPQRLIFYALCANVVQNGYDNIYCFNLALGNENKIVKIESRSFFGKLNSGDTHIKPDVIHDEDFTNNVFANCGYNFVQCVTLDKLDIKNIGILKIDCQGFEANILRGANKTIIENKPVIFIEIHSDSLKLYGETPASIEKIFKDLNYSIRQISSEGDFVATPNV